MVNQRFGLPLRSNALGELIQLRRETTVADYQTRFLTLSQSLQSADWTALD
jgi:hypothetical protein